MCENHYPIFNIWYLIYLYLYDIIKPLEITRKKAE
jgi:hypothetical protein